jgi:hypothetical protein
MADKVQADIARQLLSLADSRSRRSAILRNALLLAICFIGNTLSHRWNSPLSLIPETSLAALMGFFVYAILSIKRFPHVSKYLNWDAVQEDARQTPSD